MFHSELTIPPFFIRIVYELYFPENSKLVDSKVINLTGTIPPFLHNYQLLNINQEYGDSDEDSGTQSYDYWNTHSNSPSALLKHVSIRINNINQVTTKRKTV